MLGYVWKTADGSYEPFHWNCTLPSQEFEISDEVFLIQRETAEAYKAGRLSPPVKVTNNVGGGSGSLLGGGTLTPSVTSPVIGADSPILTNIPRLVWSGDVPPQKSMNFYTRVLSKFAATAGLKKRENQNTKIKRSQKRKNAKRRKRNFFKHF
jgi:hypothetical protein